MESLSDLAFRSSLIVLNSSAFSLWLLAFWNSFSFSSSFSSSHALIPSVRWQLSGTTLVVVGPVQIMMMMTMIMMMMILMLMMMMMIMMIMMIMTIMMMMMIVIIMIMMMMMMMIMMTFTVLFTLATRMAPPGGKGLLMMCDYRPDIRAEHTLVIVKEK